MKRAAVLPSPDTAQKLVHDIALILKSFQTCKTDEKKSLLISSPQDIKVFSDVQTRRLQELHKELPATAKNQNNSVADVFESENGVTPDKRIELFAKRIVP
jgi:hypothetical protein